MLKPPQMKAQAFPRSLQAIIELLCGMLREASWLFLRHIQFFHELQRLLYDDAQVRL